MDINFLTPINKTAALVISGGTHYNPTKKIQNADQQTPIAIIAVPDSVNELTGFRIGRLTVMGYAKAGGKWSVKCDCGVYTIRNAKAITNKANHLDRCELCRHALFVKRNYHFNKTGIDKAPESFDH